MGAKSQKAVETSGLFAAASIWVQLDGKSTARGYNAPCFAGVVHFCGVRPNAPGQWGQAGQNAECFPGVLFPPHLFLSTGGSLSANSIRDVS